MNIYTLSPTVEASNLVRIRPDGLQLDELTALKKRGEEVSARLRELAGAKGFISAPERANIQRRIVQMDLFIARLIDVMQATQLASMYQAMQDARGDSEDTLDCPIVPIKKKARSRAK